MTPAETLTYAPVLGRMVELLGNSGRLTFGEAFQQALKHCQLPSPPEHIKAALLTASFKIISSGKLPGCPEA